MKYAYYNPLIGQVMQWIDTDAHNYVLPDSAYLHNCTDSEWANRLDGEMAVVNGAIVPYIAPVPSSADILESAKAAKIIEIDAACSASIINGVISLALGTPHTYPSKILDQQNLSANVLASLLPSGQQTGWTTQQLCCDSNGNWVYVAHTAAQIQQVGMDAKTKILDNLTRCQTLKISVQAATTPDVVNAISWS